MSRLLRCFPLLLCLVLHFAVAPSVARSEARTAVSFELDVQPIFSARGCNAGACHGKARGQNGFQLSLLGFDSDFDHAALTREARGRRLFPSAPSRSLLLMKATAAVPHGGGRRFAPDSEDYRTILQWIEQGATRAVTGEPRLMKITVDPAEKSLEPGQLQPLVVTAYYSDRSSRIVTSRTSFASNEAAIVGVDAAGGIKAGPIAGEATIMARYQGLIATCAIRIPLAGDVPADLYAKLPVQNFIDKLVWSKLQSLNITPSAAVDDARYLRRVSIDIIGRLPSPEEVRAFLADKRPDKRSLLVDRLLERPEYADHWANKWADLLRPNPYRVGIKAVLNYDNWIRQQFRRNQPYDQFVRSLITARGSTFRNGAVTLFRDRRSPDEVATLASQLFLGIRLECAKCHHHPFERWSQDDFYSFAAYFARVGRKGTGLSPPISGSEEVIMASRKGDVRHPLTNEILPARPLFEVTSADNKGKRVAQPADADRDRRLDLAEWMTADGNDYFAKVMVNRVWADLMGRGMVEPVDDLRATNPASNEPLLAALAADFRRQQFDIKQLIRTITSSYVYALSSKPNSRNIADTRNYSRHYRQRLRAEVLMDAVSDITQIPNEFSAMPARSRATQIWTHRVSSLFLDTFGRPDPNQDPPCERTGESTVTQTLHLMNSPQLHKKITSDRGRAATLASSDKTVDQIVQELYLLTYNRTPSAEEQEIGRSVFQRPGTTRRIATEDLLWALVNTPEFQFKD